jgi:hypothetical protein
MTTRDYIDMAVCLMLANVYCAFNVARSMGWL